MIVIYIAGPFRGPSAWAIEQNIRRAEELALAVWRSGMAALCPHTNTRFFQGAAADEVWLDGDLELLRRCDAILLVPGWERSQGARAERACAIDLNLPVFEDLVVLQRWAAAKSDNDDLGNPLPPDLGERDLGEHGDPSCHACGGPVVLGEPVAIYHAACDRPATP